MMRILIACVVLFALTFVHHVCADGTYPTYPIASEMQANVTFSPGVYPDDSQKFKGTFHYKANGQKVALMGRDSLRTNELILFLDSTQYVMSEFGEFGYDCIKYPNYGFTGFAGAFLPPFGFDMSETQYAGEKQCGDGKCDLFVLEKAGSKADLYFVAGASTNRPLVRVETVDKSGVTRIAEFSAWQATTQDDSLFEIPKKSKCHAP